MQIRADIEKLIKEYEVRTLFNEKNINRAVEQVSSNEKILYISPTNAIIYTGINKKTIPGIVVITDKRVFIYSKIASNVQIESFNMSDLNSVDSSSNGITGSKIKLHTNTKSLEFLISYKSSIATKVVQLLNETMYVAKSKNQTTNTSTDSIDKLKKVAELRDAGIISQDEFEQKKQVLLDKI